MISTHMAGKLKEPKVITDFNQRIVCLLPVGFYFSDERWEKIWQRFDEKGDTLSMADLKKLFPGLVQVFKIGQMNDLV